MKLRLIEIARDGSPARCTGFMSPAARDAMEGTAAFYEAVGFTPPWLGYLVDRDGDVVGSCAFKGAPSGGEVEIAYQVFAGFENRGIGTETARQLVRIAREADPAITVTAQTLPVESASTAILRRLGFELRGAVDHPDDGPVWDWRLLPSVPFVNGK